jgi:hypothetical protein
MTDQRMYQLYKPLRNHLNKVGIENSLYVIWAYINNFQVNLPIPEDIETIPQVLQKESYNRGVYEWELALLARQILVLGEEYGPMARHTLQKWNYFSRAINKVKDFENEAYALFGGVENIMAEMRRISYRQFPWQANRPNVSMFLRYYKIFSQPDLAVVIEKVLKLTIQQWYTLGAAVFGAFLEHSKLTVDPSIVLPTITSEDFGRFFEYVSTDLPTIQKVIHNEIVLDDTFIYAVNPLETTPLVLINGYYYCPITTFLTWRITAGIYYDLVDNPSFANPFGQALNSYLIEVAEAFLVGSSLTVHKEEKYGPHLGKDSVDIIIRDNMSAFFVESKAIRRTKKLRSQLLTDAEWIEEINRVAKAIVQVYATIHDYLARQYLHFPFIPNLKIYPFIVTLEDLYIMGREVLNELDQQITDLLNEKSLPTTYLKTMPYIVSSVDDYEKILQVISSFGIEKFMNGSLTEFQRGNSLGAHIFNTYKTHLISLSKKFPGEFDKIFSDRVTGVPNNELEEEITEEEF